MRVRAWWTTVVLAGVAVACGDQPTEVVPERQTTQGQMTQGPGMIALATSSSDDGLSITTDKDDYQPGDTVWFTGAGWPANDTLDILLEDEPATHEPHTWWVSVNEDGGFRDSTYVVDVDDIGVTFTLTATSRGTGRWLTVQFTDGTISNASLSFFPGGSTTSPPPAGSPPTGCTGASGTSVQSGTTICALASFTIAGSGGTPVSIRWLNPSGAVVAVSARAANFGNGVIGAQAFAATFAPAITGVWSAMICESSNINTTGANAGGCPSSTARDTATFTVTAAAVATTTSIISSQSPSGFGQEVTFTATVESGSPATPVTTGSVTFRSGTCSGTVLSGPTALDGNGQASFNKSDLAIGSHTIWACYGGAAGFQTSSASLEQEVKSTATEIDLVSSDDPSVTGQSVTFTATVTNNSNPVTAGQVAFKKGGSECSDAAQVQGPQNLSGSGQITYSAAFDASDSPITIRACYSGSGPLLDPSEAAILQNVDKASTTTTVGSSPSPSVFSQSVTFTVTVAVESPGAGTPTGNVTLKDGSCAGTTLGGPTGVNGSGQATFNISTLTAGTHTVAGCYQGDDDFSGSSGTVSHTVNKAETSTTLGSSPNPSVFSGTVTFTATVQEVAPAVATPVGTVVFKNGNCAAIGSLGSATLNGSGVASLGVSTLAVGTHTITACYQGNANFKPSDDDVSQQVDKAETKTVVTSTPAASVFSQTVNFDVSVTPKAPAVATPVGGVTLKDGSCAGTTLGGPTALSGTGEASFNVSTLTVGTHTIAACYAGNESFEESEGSVSHTVDQASTATAITSSPNPSIVAETVTFDVTVTPVAPAVATPVGLVTLKGGTCATGTSIGLSAALDGTGAVSFSVSTLSAGPHTVSACYAGNVNFKSSSGSVNQLVKYNFDGLFAPVDRPNTYNVSKAGQAIPLKWRLTDFFGNPVLTLTTVTVKVSDAACLLGSTTDQVEEYASGSSGLQNHGDGNYQFNWKTPGSYAPSCKRISLEFVPGYAEGPLAFFTFKK